MRAWLNQRLWRLSPLLVGISLCSSCGKPKAPLVSEDLPERATAVNTSTSRPIPRRTQPLVITNELAVAEAVKPLTNNPPVVSCGAPQTLPCGPLDGQPITLSAHVEDADGHAL